MPHYLVRASYSTEAVQAMIAKPQDREAIARQAVESVGGTLHCLYFAFGDDDVIAIAELPENTTAAALSLVTSSSGSFSRFTTTPLLTSAEAIAAMDKAGAMIENYKPPTG